AQTEWNIIADYKFNNPYIAWDPSEYGNISEVTIGVGIWSPDLLMCGSVPRGRGQCVVQKEEPTLPDLCYLSSFNDTII
ncbi:hypothetical protein PENTCL1PPCAC_24466, partial [Pristionchus entomophagus]